MRIVKLLCKNNTWIDFGNHTGFKDIPKKCNHLIVGDLYELEVKREFAYDLYTLKTSHTSGSSVNGFSVGINFTIKEGDNVVLSSYDLHNFFYSVQEMREMRLEKILNR